MALDIDQSFVRQFESEVHEAYQRQGSLLRGTTRLKTGVRGQSTTFQRIGIGVAGPKGRNGTVPAMNIDHDPIECFLQDRYAGDWYDKLDELKVNHDERAVIANAGAYALGRATDDFIITALNTGTNTAAINASALDLAAFAGWIRSLVDRDIQVRLGEVFAVVSPAVWQRLLLIPQFTSQDWMADSLPFKSGTWTMRPWADVMWILHTGLTGGAGARACHIYHRNAVAHAVGAEVTTDITWHGDHAAWFINNMMSMGAVLVDARGVERRVVNEGA